jgi:hypothetical protein
MVAAGGVRACSLSGARSHGVGAVTRCAASAMVAFDRLAQELDVGDRLDVDQRLWSHLRAHSEQPLLQAG